MDMGSQLHTQAALSLGKPLPFKSIPVTSLRCTDSPQNNASRLCFQLLTSLYPGLSQNVSFHPHQLLLSLPVIMFPSGREILSQCYVQPSSTSTVWFLLCMPSQFCIRDNVWPKDLKFFLQHLFINVCKSLVILL
jgi:hypothetical protein